LSLQVAKIKGIPIRLHFTLVIVSFLIAWALAAMLMPEIYSGLNISVYWIMGIIGAIILLVSVLLHELAHSIVALRYGLKVREIILFIFGGISVIEDQDEEASKDFRKEFKIAVVGPITSFVIAAILATSLWLLIYVTTGSNNNNINNTDNIPAIIAAGVLQYGALVNVLIGGINLIPAFPSDGGRILRSALLRSKRDYDKSTKITARIGIAISYGFMGFGFLFTISGSFISGVWLLLVGWFLNSGARSYLAQHQLTSILSSVRLPGIMNTQIIAVRKDMLINHLIHDYLSVSAKDSFPVIDDYAHLVGMVASKDAWRVPEHGRSLVQVMDIMIQKSHLVIMHTYRTAEDGRKYMKRKCMDTVFICDQEGKLIGLISKTDTMNAAGKRKDYTEGIGKLSHHKS
jgi:Zn-dependent protease/predicted transcriptional regulator